MSTEHHESGHAEIRIPLHEDVSFEERDVRVSAILKFLISLGITVVLSYILAFGVYRGLTRYWRDTYVPPPPSRGDTGPTLPPEPRLQGMPGHLNDPQLDWREMVKEDAKANDTFEWIDRQRGIAQIPVKDAMQAIVEKGLPALPAAPPATATAGATAGEKK
jgi:hypothetical protein